MVLHLLPCVLLTQGVRCSCNNVIINFILISDGLYVAVQLALRFSHHLVQRFIWIKHKHLHLAAAASATTLLQQVVVQLLLPQRAHHRLVRHFGFVYLRQTRVERELMQLCLVIFPTLLRGALFGRILMLLLFRGRRLGRRLHHIRLTIFVILRQLNRTEGLVTIGRCLRTDVTGLAGVGSGGYVTLADGDEAGRHALEVPVWAFVRLILTLRPTYLRLCLRLAQAKLR